jgi:dipeptidyl-peptidase 4
MVSGTDTAALSFPRQQAITARFTHGAPRSFTVAGDGSRVAFLRSGAGDDPRACLWALDLDGGGERLVADPATILGSAGEQLSAEERARRERTRERSQGVVSYSADHRLRRAAFALSGRLYLADVATGECNELPARGPVLEPGLDPTGERVAYVAEGALRLTGPGERDRVLASDDDPDVAWGVAEFVAAEEMERFRGFWWAPDGSAILAARVDNRPVGVWHIANPADPTAVPQVVRYPAAGTDNAVVTVHVLALDGRSLEVAWDRERFPYLLRVRWEQGHGPLLAVMSRDQRIAQVLSADETTGLTTVLAEERDDVWVELPPGVPRRAPGGRLVTTMARGGVRRLAIDGEPVTPERLHVLDVIAVSDAGVLISATDEPTERHLFRVTSAGALERLTDGPGVHGAVADGGVLVMASASMDRFGSSIVVLRDGRQVATIASHAATPVLEPRVEFLRAGPRALRTAILRPRDHRPGRSLPVLLDPYGGPHLSRVVAARNAYLESQWWAEQGFAVVVADGRGTPGRGVEWEQAIHRTVAEVILRDQLDALRAAAAADPDLDLSRVAIRGWSFGGYLAALAVLRRPKDVHAAVAGAPVTDWRLYDTFYTERYLGDPGEEPDVYARNSLLADAPALRRPLLLIHGLADDNVVAAHTLRLSSALMEAGRPHDVLPLTGVMHLANQPVVAENLLALQLEFLKRALAVSEPGAT